MKKLRLHLFLSIVLIFLSLNLNANAAPAQAGDIMVSCNFDGTVSEYTAKTGVSLGGISYDTSNYYLTGIDVGLFYRNGTFIKSMGSYMNTNINMDFGTITKYDYGSIYTVKYRVTVGVIGGEGNTLAGDWTNTNLYFKPFRDTTPPTQPTITANTNWTNVSSVPATIAHGTDSGGSGVDRTEYSLSGATILGWTTYNSAFSITNAGQTTITARTIDKMGNISSNASAVVKIDRTVPTITINPNSTTFCGDGAVQITCTDTASGLSVNKYAWTQTAALPADSDPAWTAFTSPGTAKQTQAGAWYLHTQTTDNAGNKTSTNKTYTIVPKLSIAVRPDTGVTVLGGGSGKVVLLSHQGQELKQETWGHGNTANIYAVQTYNDGKIILAGQDGSYQVRDASGNWKTPGTWEHTGYSIKAITPLYNTAGNPTQEMLMAGNQGKWQVRNANGTLNTSQKGTCHIAEITFAICRKDGYTILAGSEGKITIIGTDRKTIAKQETWKTSTGTGDTRNINAAVILPDDSILFAGQGGKYQRRTSTGIWQTPGTWDHTGQDIKTLTLLPNGNVLMTGGDGYFQVLKISGTYTLTKGEKGKYNIENIQAAYPREDGRIVIEGNDWCRQYYKYNTPSKTTVNKATSNSVILDTQWDGQGYKGAKVEKSTNGTTWTESVCSWNTEGTQSTITGLSSNTKYYFRIKALMGEPIYYKSKPIAVTTK